MAHTYKHVCPCIFALCPQDRMMTLEQLRLELDSRRRTVDSLQGKHIAPLQTPA